MQKYDELFSQAEEYKMGGKPSEAVKIYNTILKKDADNIPALMNSANLHFLLGNLKKSIKAYERVLTLKPNFCFVSLIIELLILYVLLKYSKR
jgi:tetratricopeptide (TPR) repeat protein